tara:strand:- start:348 stop:626 length:279 start_codon:yes stop_codon:yes gene_type:complete
MEKIQESLANKQIDKDSHTDKIIPMFCPVCEFIMGNSLDHDCYIEFSCCQACTMKFAAPRRDDWKNGWRPSAPEIKDHKLAISSQSPSFILD